MLIDDIARYFGVTWGFFKWLVILWMKSACDVSTCIHIHPCAESLAVLAITTVLSTCE